ncbi:MAG: UDP-N-acetylmuramate--L-alanine ligase [Patescibacteria group bacterium]
MEGIHKIHFIGVGGIGMSALARHLKQEKKIVSGSDRSLSPITKQLSRERIQIFGEQVAENITKDIDLVIYTEAMSKDHPEMEAARALHIPMMNYFEALSVAMNPYYLIAVSGTHGKTTTTAMITDIFEAAEKDPTAVIGSLRSKTKSNYRAGKSKYAVVEACEYKKDFLHLTPDVLVITNIELDHTDFYPTLAQVQSAFREMIGRVNEGGVVVTDASHGNILPVLKDFTGTIIDYKKFLDLELPLKHPGLHNRQNAAAAKAVAKHEKVANDTIDEALKSYAGTWRRFEFKGDLNGAPVYDDYAHHPTAIKATLEATREAYPDRRIVAVFQPHTYTRTVALFKDFAKSFARADEVILLPIYAAREQNTTGVNSRELAVAALEYAPNTRYLDSLPLALDELRRTITKNDVLIIMGAGDVTKLADALTA